MNQLNIHPTRQIEIPNNAPIAATILKPVIFMDADVFCCVFGDDLSTALTGFGDTIEDALEDWEDTLKERIHADDQDDEVILEVLQLLTKHREKMSFKNQ